MKKMLAMLLALVMAFALVSCGGSDGSAASGSAPASASAEASAPAEGSASASAEASASAPAEGSAPAELTLVEDGKLIMATNAQFPPYEMIADGDGVNGTGLEGIDVEIAAALAEKLGLELVIDDMDFDSALVAVQENRCDMVLAGLSYREDRDEIMDFSDPYAQGVQVVIVTADSAIASVDDLANAEMIGTQRGTTGYIYCADDYGDDHVSAYDNGAAAVQALMNGQVDAVVIDKAPAEAYVAENEGLAILETEYVVEDYCLAVDEGNAALLDALNGALNELISDGTVQSIVDKYITAD